MIEVKMECVDESTFTFNSYFTREDVTIELQKIVSDCDPQCQLCFTLIRQLTAHVAENHSQTKHEEEETGKVGEEIYQIFDDDDELERDADGNTFAVILPDSKFKTVEEQGQGQEFPEQQITATARRASSTRIAVAKNSKEIQKKKNGKRKRKNNESSAEDDYVMETGRVTRKPVKERTSVTLKSSKIHKNKVDSDFSADGDERDTNSESEISNEDFDILKSELKSSREKRHMHRNKPSYTCRICQEEFIESNEFNDHFKTHDQDRQSSEPEGNMMCGICNAIFPIIGELTKHVRMTHELARLHECHMCGLKFDLKELTQHFELFHPDQLPFSCKICMDSSDKSKLTFSGPQELKLHDRIVHRKRKVYPCDQCSKTFLGRILLKRHSQVHEKERKKHVCDKCGTSYDTLSELDIHNMRHVPKKNFICGAEDCGKRFSAQEVLDAHVRLAHGQENPQTSTKSSTSKGSEIEITKIPPFACRFCTHTYTEPYLIQRHLRKDHGNLLVNKFNCYICQSKFLERLKLLQHMRTEHSLDKPYGCEICNMGFGQSNALTRHIWAKHTGEKPFICPICKKGFIIKSKMEDHIANHHTGEKLYKCDQCEKSYACKAHLTTHELTHEGKKPFMCDQCGKCFVSSVGLNNHSIVHKKGPNGEKLRPYACKDCNASFVSKNTLNTHAIIHSGLRPHMCQECGMCFKRAHHMRRHLKTMHTDKNILENNNLS